MKSPHDHIVWIVEDDLDDRILLQEAFAETPIPVKVVVFQSAITALQTLGITHTEELPDIIVSDYNMPMMNGYQFMEALGAHRRYAAIKKVVLSTCNYLYNAEECLKKGAHAYYIKPPDYIELVELASSIVRPDK
jgi:two-component system chemotaxis response regulator CheY